MEEPEIVIQKCKWQHRQFGDVRNPCFCFPQNCRCFLPEQEICNQIEHLDNILLQFYIISQATVFVSLEDFLRGTKYELL